MLIFLVRRLLVAIPTLLVVVAVSFFLMRLAPGGPFDSQRKLPPEIEANMNRAYDLDRPLVVQFGTYLGHVLHGDFGPSFKNQDFTVSQLIAIGAPISIRVGLCALLFAVAAGVALGTFAALRQNTTADVLSMGVAMAGITIPAFVTAPLFILLFADTWHVLPAGDWEGGDLPHLILPVVTLALPQIAIVARLTRGSVLEVLRSNFVRTARAKGLSDAKILWRHVLRASLLPLVSYLGPAAASLMTGSLVVEKIFGLPGIGRYFVDGAMNRDYTLVMGVVIVYAFLILLLNLIADLAYGWFDPRVRYGR